MRLVLEYSKNKKLFSKEIYVFIILYKVSTIIKTKEPYSPKKLIISIAIAVAFSLILIGMLIYIAIKVKLVLI